jgi:mannose-1-phosphate guanylyltransferase
MKAMILAAGKGTRVQPITHDIPKPMIPIINTPVMELIIKHLNAHGFEDFVVNLSHLADKIEDYFGDGSRLGVNMTYSWEGQFEGDKWKGSALGSAGGMQLIQQRSGFFDSTFAVLCGDAVIDVNFTEALKFHREKGAIATIVMKEVPLEDVSSYGVVVTDTNGRIKSFQEKPKPEEAKSNVINTGIYIFEPEVFDFIPKKGEFDIGGDLFPKLVATGAPFYGITLPFQWVDIGKTPDFWVATQMALKGEIHGFRMPGKQIKPGIFVGSNVVIEDGANISGPVYIGGSTVIRAGAEIIGPALIQSGCEIEGGAIVDKSIVWHHTRVDSLANIEQKIVFGPHCIDAKGHSVDLKEAGFDWLISDRRNKNNYLNPLEK